MYKMCVFAGTTEGRELVSFLCSQDVMIYACVATDYGQTLLKEAENLVISAKRLTEDEMKSLFEQEQFDLVVDATHPYANLVTENIANACTSCQTPYLRLLRDRIAAPEDSVFLRNIEEAVSYLNTVDGNILLTTGSKELHKFAPVSGFADRVYARVLPMEQSLQLCDNAGMKKNHIIAMQGPFSVEMNVATLKSVDAKFMVTKDTGSAGGFDEKIAAAQQAGVKLIIIGRPKQEQGMNFAEVIDTLCQKFNLIYRPQVTIVGIGPGSREAMTGQVRRAVDDAVCIIGAKRMIEAVAEPGQVTVQAIAPEEIASFIHTHWHYRRFVVAMSGDVGFFSGTKKLLPLLSGCDVQLLPGLSSLVYLCACLGTSYEDVVPVSAHGREGSIIPQIRCHRRIFTLVGGENGMGKLCRELVESGLGNVHLTVGEQLSYPDETITMGLASQLAQSHFQSLSVALIENDQASYNISFGLPDEAFARVDSVPMTKSEVRAVCLSKLALSEESIAWDIGAGTGSVSIEMALQARKGQVYAIERKEEAVELLKGNCLRFQTDHLTIISGSAPDVCIELPAPTHAFIGGSSGNIKSIIHLLLKKNPNVRIVATAIALESVAELTECMKTFSFTKTEVVSMTVARNRKLGAYNLMTGQNPIYIFTMQGGKA